MTQTLVKKVLDDLEMPIADARNATAVAVGFVERLLNSVDPAPDINAAVYALRQALDAAEAASRAWDRANEESGE